jgi:hypothetical protein
LLSTSPSRGAKCKRPIRREKDSDVRAVDQKRLTRMFARYVAFHIKGDEKAGSAKFFDASVTRRPAASTEWPRLAPRAA